MCLHVQRVYTNLHILLVDNFLLDIVVKMVEVKLQALTHLPVSRSLHSHSVSEVGD